MSTHLASKGILTRLDGQKFLATETPACFFGRRLDESAGLVRGAGAYRPRRFLRPNGILDSRWMAENA